MKQTTKQTLNPAPLPGLTSRTLPTISKLTQQFIQAEKELEKVNGVSKIEEVGFALTMIAMNYETFSLNDVANLVAQFEISIEETSAIYNKWIAMLKQQEPPRIEERLSVYRYETYSFK